MFEWRKAEENLATWVVKAFPLLEVEDWRHEFYNFKIMRRVTITTEAHPIMADYDLKWLKELKEKGIHPPDFKLWQKIEYGRRAVCWVDVKWTDKIISHLYNVNWKKFGNYKYITRMSHLLVFIVLFAGSPCPESPSMYGTIEEGSFSNHIILKPVDEIGEEIQKCLRTHRW